MLSCESQILYCNGCLHVILDIINCDGKLQAGRKLGQSAASTACPMRQQAVAIVLPLTASQVKASVSGR